jgi:hypothetical protein
MSLGKTSRMTRYVLGCMGISVVGILVIVLYVIYMRSLPPKYPWREQTSPLSKEVLQDLCNRFSMAANDTRCADTAIVYADEFFPLIKEKFPKAQSTYDEVNRLLKPYETKRQPLFTQAEGKNYLTVTYDFTGDRINEVIFMFTESGQVFDVIFRYGDENS